MAMTPRDAFLHAQTLWPDQIVSATEFQGQAGRSCKVSHAPKSFPSSIKTYYGNRFESCFEQAGDAKPLMDRNRAETELPAICLSGGWSALQHALSRLTFEQQVHLGLGIVALVVIAAFTQIAIRRGCVWRKARAR